MNKKAFLILMAILAIFGLAACASSKGPVDIHNAKISANWSGVYTGTIPSASGSGINVHLKLNQNETFELRYDYLDKPSNPFISKGSFKWDDAGDIITLDITDAPPHYKVGENKLIQLDMEGNLITGKLADDYVLRKLDP